MFIDNEINLDISASLMGRRDFLSFAGLAASGLLLAACGNNSESRTATSLANSEEANKIRQEIKDFESSHWDDVSPDTIKWIYSKIIDLHRATFGLPAVPTTLIVADHKTVQSTGKDYGMSQLRQEIPWGDASALGANSASLKPNEAAHQAFVLLYSGKEELVDPSLNKLSVMRMIGMHEYVHSQTKFLKPGNVVIDGVSYNVPLQRGLKWVTDERTNNQKAWYFDEVNTQYLTEYMNDPSGQDDSFDRLLNSPAYNKCITWVRGGRVLRDFYGKLCLPVGVVRQFHFNANAQGLLAEIDKTVVRNSIVLPERASTSLIRLSLNQGTEEERITTLQGLAQAAA